MDAMTILLLDDEAQIREDLGGWLARSGYHVHKASNTTDAKRVILAGELDCAIIDLTVGYDSEYGGLEVAQFLKRHQPRAKAIVLTGYVQPPDDERFRDVDGFISKGAPGNYIRAVLNKVKEIEGSAPPKTCYVIMPLGKSKTCTEAQWTEIFENTIKPAVENAGLGFSCKRAITVSGSIIHDILDNLNRADVVIADLTDRNPNVFYELGVRHSLRNSTILIAQDLNHVPFDLRDQAVIQYGWRVAEERSKFAMQLRKSLALVDPGTGPITSPVLAYLGRA